ncbi:MAG: hypothetical protein AB8E15_05515 [Bdellovibrionales bacterium]
MRLIFSLVILFSSPLFAGDWKIHASNMRANMAELTQKEQAVKSLIQQKNNTKDKALISSLLDQIVTAHEDYKKAVDKYNEERNHIRFEHPEQGDDTERSYRYRNAQEIEDLEDAVGIYGRLGKVKRKLKKTYGIKDKKRNIEVKEEKKEEFETETPRIKLSF